MIKVCVILMYRRNIHKYIMQMNLVSGMAINYALIFSVWKVHDGISINHSIQLHDYIVIIILFLSGSRNQIH